MTVSPCGSALNIGDRPIFKDKIAVITGAGSGLGRQLAIDFARRGSKVVLADFNEAGLNETVAQLNLPAAQVSWMKTDVTSQEDCARLIEHTLQTFGSVDFLVLSAGMSMWARFEQLPDLSVFRRLMDVNFMGALHCIHPALKALKTSSGMIVAISSLQGALGVNDHSGYSASKHALNGFLEALSYEVGEQIHILTVMPGWIQGTNLRQNAFKANGTPEGKARKHSKESVTVVECSDAIFRAMEGRKRDIFVPPKLRYLTWLNAVAPGIVKRLVSRAMKDQKH